jgi:Anti-sigma-K factor rskA, C-terminal
MTDRSAPSDPPEIDIDPYADEAGRVGSLFGDEVGDDVADLLADPAMWEVPSADLGDRIVAAVSSEAHVDPMPTGPTVSEGSSGSVVRSSRFAQVRPALLGAAAAMLLVFGGIVALSALSGNPQPEDVAGDFVPTGLLPDVGGTVEVTSFDSGLEIVVDAPSLPRRANGEFYEGWLRLDDGRLVPIGTFHEGNGVTLWAGIELDAVVGMTITLEEAVAADSPEQASSGRVVLKFDFPEG